MSRLLTIGLVLSLLVSGAIRAADFEDGASFNTHTELSHEHAGGSWPDPGSADAHHHCHSCVFPVVVAASAIVVAHDASLARLANIDVCFNSLTYPPPLQPPSA